MNDVVRKAPLSRMKPGGPLGGNERLEMLQGGNTRYSTPNRMLDFVHANFDDTARGFVHGSWTPQLGPVPRVVQQYGWPVDDYTYLLEFDIDAADSAGYLLDLRGPNGGMSIVANSKTSASFRYFNPSIYDRTLSFPIAEGINTVLIHRKGDTLWVKHNGTLSYPSGLAGSEPVDVAWPDAVGVCAQADGTAAMVNQATRFRVLRGEFTDVTTAAGEVGGAVVFDGRSLGAPKTDNGAWVAEADQLTHGIHKNDIALFWQGLLHSVLKSGAGVEIESGENAIGGWLKLYDVTGILAVIQIFVDPGQAGWHDVALPLQMPTSLFFAEGSPDSPGEKVTLITDRGNFTQNSIRVATLFQASSYTSKPANCIAIWIRGLS